MNEDDSSVMLCHAIWQIVTKIIFTTESYKFWIYWYPQFCVVFYFILSCHFFIAITVTFFLPSLCWGCHLIKLLVACSVLFSVTSAVWVSWLHFTWWYYTECLRETLVVRWNTFLAIHVCVYMCVKNMHWHVLM
jgi:hypothetical protein